MPSRRALLALPLPALAAPVRTESGWTQDWFHDSFLVLAEDLAEARAAGKRLAILFDQRGCPYCETMHREYLADPAMEEAVRGRFRILQLDLHGAREVTDLDGQRMEERALARRWRVTFTPTIVFLPEQADATRPGRAQEVARMPGLLPRPQFRALFDQVAERGPVAR